MRVKQVELELTVHKRTTVRDLAVVPFLVPVSSVAPWPVHIVVWVSAALIVKGRGESVKWKLKNNHRSLSEQFKNLHCPPDLWWGESVGWSCCAGEASENSMPGKSLPEWWWRLDLGMCLHFQPYSLKQQQRNMSVNWLKRIKQTDVKLKCRLTSTCRGLSGGGRRQRYRGSGGLWFGRTFGTFL